MEYVKQIQSYELRFEATGSRGPGGQHVNKTNSAVILRWNIFATTSFTDEQKKNLIEKLKPRATHGGDVLIRCQAFRHQEANRKHCLVKLEAILQEAFFRPKKRTKTKPTRGSVEKRHAKKKQRSQTKKLREKIRPD